MNGWSYPAQVFETILTFQTRYRIGDIVQPESRQCTCTMNAPFLDRSGADQWALLRALHWLGVLFSMMWC